MAHKAKSCQPGHSVPTVAPASFPILGIMCSSFYWNLLLAGLTDRSGTAFSGQAIVCDQSWLVEGGLATPKHQLMDARKQEM